MTYTTIKIRGDTTVIRSDCPQCGRINSTILKGGLRYVGEIEVTCNACRKHYRTGIFSTRWDSGENLAQ